MYFQAAELHVQLLLGDFLVVFFFKVMEYFWKMLWFLWISANSYLALTIVVFWEGSRVCARYQMHGVRWPFYISNRDAQSFYKIIYATSASVSVSRIGEMTKRIDALASTLNKYLVARWHSSIMKIISHTVPGLSS